MTSKDEQPAVPRPVSAKPSAADSVPLHVQCFTHKGEVVVTFSRPVAQWFLSSDAAREFARGFNEAAALLDAQEAGRATKQ